MSRAERDFLFALPEQQVVQIEGCDPIRVVHGSPSSPFEQIFRGDLPTLQRAIAATCEPVLVCGHTHRPWAFRQDGKLALNPGAVCGPLDGFIGAQYAILSWQADGWQVQHRQVRYDMAAVRRAFEESGLLAASGALGRVFLLSIESGQDVARLFLDQAYRLSEQAGLKNPKTVPDEIWDRLDRSFDWQAAFWKRTLLKGASLEKNFPRLADRNRVGRTMPDRRVGRVPVGARLHRLLQSPRRTAGYARLDLAGPPGGCQFRLRRSVLVPCSTRSTRSPKKPRKKIEFLTTDEYR